MPVYDYKCKEHGIFYGLATVEDHSKPTACPNCGALSPRIILVAPNILTMPKNKKKAFEVNEKNKHEPTHSTGERRTLDHQHANTCGCSTHTVTKSKLMYTATGEKMFPSMRPWMISH